MSNFSDIKKRLSMSTTLPAGTGGAAPYMMGSAHAHHEHAADGSCCGHDHTHDHAHDHGHNHHHDDEDDECDEDHTNPSGGCGCC